MARSGRENSFKNVKVASLINLTEVKKNKIIRRQKILKVVKVYLIWRITLLTRTTQGNTVCCITLLPEEILQYLSLLSVSVFYLTRNCLITLQIALKKHRYTGPCHVATKKLLILWCKKCEQ